MAVFKWLTRIEGNDLVGAIRDDLEEAGLVVNLEATTCQQLYASDSVDSHLTNNARVSVIATWSSQGEGEILIEIRSNEPMLRPQSRCEQLAKELQTKLQPL